MLFEHTRRLGNESFDEPEDEIDSDALPVASLIPQLSDEEVFDGHLFDCSGCDESHADAKEWYISRDCLTNPTFLPDCVQKREEVICRPDHTHLYLPLSHVRECRWGEQTSERNKKYILDAQKWLDQVKTDWHLDAPALRSFDDVMTVVHGIVVFKRCWREKRYQKPNMWISNSAVVNGNP